MLTTEQGVPIMALSALPLTLVRSRPVWDEDRIAAACKSFEAGVPFDTGCEAAGGVSMGLRGLMERDESVRLQVTEARAKGRERLIREMLADETGKLSRAREWLLERLDPRGFAPPATTINQHVSGADGAAIHVTLSPGDARQLAKGST